MRKNLVIVICIFLSLVLLIPIPLHLKDGGTVIYQAILYSIEDIHRINHTDVSNPYINGIRIKILGLEVYHREA